jgi:hypothetical protein
MSTWSVTTTNTQRAGTADTTAQAWDAAHAAAADIVRGHVLDPLILDIDGLRGAIYPVNSGNTAVDVAATLEIIEDGRVGIVSAHQAASRQSTSAAQRSTASGSPKCTA